MGLASEVAGQLSLGLELGLGVARPDVEMEQARPGEKERASDSGLGGEPGRAVVVGVSDLEDRARDH